jgi:hypothetical protein
MNGLLANPVISGLLGGGPNAIRAAAEQQRMALAPRGGGGMSGAPGAIVTQDRSGADLGAGLAGLGKGLSAIGKMRDKAKQSEAFEATIAASARTAGHRHGSTLRRSPSCPGEVVFQHAGQDDDIEHRAIRLTARPAPHVTPEKASRSRGLSQAGESLDLKGSAETGFYTVERGPDGKPVVSMVISPRSEPMTSLQKDFGFARKDGYKGSFTDFVRETRSTAIERAPQGYERTPDGMRAVPGGPADPNAPTTAPVASTTTPPGRRDRQSGRPPPRHRPDRGPAGRTARQAGSEDPRGCDQGVRRQPGSGRSGARRQRPARPVRPVDRRGDEYRRPVQDPRRYDGRLDPES